MMLEDYQIRSLKTWIQDSFAGFQKILCDVLTPLNTQDLFEEMLRMILESNVLWPSFKPSLLRIQL